VARRAVAQRRRAGTPVASFDGEPRVGRSPLEVRFTDTSTGAPTAWFWDFGDGATSTEQHPKHVYVSPGLFTVRLAVSNSSGSDELVRSRFVIVFRAGAPPTDDTFVRRYGHQNNHGAEPAMRVELGSDPEDETYLRFEVAEAGRHLLLLRTVEDGGTAEVRIHEVSGGWNEHSLTWNLRPPRERLILTRQFRRGGWIAFDLGHVEAGALDLGISASHGEKVVFWSKESAHSPELVRVEAR
jgi:PKD repeat protein